MIESIEIRNFQIHKKTKIDFDPGVTIISGTSDNGKSSIIRCFRWLFDNRPQGYNFRRWNTPDKVITSVDIVVDGETISRKRGKVRNEYFFKDTTYKALRADVPDDIKEFLQVLPFNVQMQSGKIFLFENTDSETAKMINDVSGISIIDDILKESNRRMRELGSEEKILTGMIRDKNSQKNALKSFVSHKKRVVALKEKVSAFEEIEEHVSEIEEHIETYRNLRKKKKNLPDTESLQERVLHIKESYDAVEEKEKDLDSISEMVEFLEENKLIPEKHILKANKKISYLSKLNESSLESSSIIDHLEDEIDNIESLVGMRKENKINLKSLIRELEEIKEECGICPVCEKEW